MRRVLWWLGLVVLALAVPVILSFWRGFLSGLWADTVSELDALVSLLLIVGAVVWSRRSRLGVACGEPVGATGDGGPAAAAVGKPLD